MPVENGFKWPGNAKAAISLTYDDGYDSYLDMVIPDLDAHGFKGTFYLTGSFPAVQSRLSEWSSAFGEGHEIGNHTWSHPCDPQIYAGQFGDIDNFITQETGKMEGWLANNGLVNGYRSFAYPCGIVGLGPAGTAGVQEARYTAVCGMTFNNARTAGGPPNDPIAALNNRFLISSAACTFNDLTSATSLKYCQDSIDQNLWGVLAFHDLTEAQPTQGSSTARSVHLEVLDWLKQKGDEVWVASVREIYSYIGSY